MAIPSYLILAFAVVGLFVSVAEGQGFKEKLEIGKRTEYDVSRTMAVNVLTKYHKALANNNLKQSLHGDIEGLCIYVEAHKELDGAMVAQVAAVDTKRPTDFPNIVRTTTYLNGDFVYEGVQKLSPENIILLEKADAIVEEKYNDWNTTDQDNISYVVKAVEQFHRKESNAKLVNHFVGILYLGVKKVATN